MNLSIETLSKTYSNGVKALDGVNLEIKPGCLVYWGQMVLANLL